MPNSENSFIPRILLLTKEVLDRAPMRCFEIPRSDKELYDIQVDPNELENLATHPNYEEVLEDMRSRLTQMQEITKEELPSEFMPDDFFRETGLLTKYRIRPRPSKAEYMKAREQGLILMNPEMKED